MPTYDHAYRAKQEQRMQTLVNGLVARRDPVRAGRVIPDHGDLPIGAGRHFEATVMFLDICGSSARGSDDRRAQSDMLTALSMFFAEMIRVVEDHGGTVEKNTGDGLMAYFSKGEVGRSAQTTALAAALTMLASASRLIDPLTRAVGVGRLPFRICLDHGPITVAEVGAARGFRGIVAIGSTANIASKMLALADEDTILIGEAVLHGLPPDWAVHATDPRPTGFSYTGGVPYLWHRYDGRWVDE
jgi:class 3 adenylate cyclase